MKHLNKLISVALGLVMLTSCADNEVLSFMVTQPDSLANLNYLQKYDVLKNYVDRAENPNFKLGVGVNTSSFDTQDALYQIAKTNFDEVTAGYEMKHGAVVQSSGDIDTSTVKGFLLSAQEAGLSVYGHTLCWHSNQNATFLNKLIEPTVVVTGEGDLTTAYCAKMTNDEAKGYWEAQVLFTPDPMTVTPGATLELEFMVKGTAEGSMMPSEFNNWGSASDFSSVNITKDWTLATTTCVHPTDRNDLISILFNIGSFVGTIYIDDIAVYELDSNGNRGKNLIKSNSNLDSPDATKNSLSTFSWSSSSISYCGVSDAGEGYVSGIEYVEKTDEEKAEILDTALHTWIRAMVETGNGYVPAWDVVNEPMDDANPHELKTGKNIEELASDEFYWQDYLGKDYAVKAFNYARQYAGANVKLFINDYGLESVGGEKLDGLLEYIDYVESKGATIDGIGTQMHVNVNTADRDAIVAMFRKLAATGKLIKVSELDMGISDGVTAITITDEQLKAQADLYQFIVESYLDNTPAAQRYGITQWSPTDASASSLWRAGERIGLWNASFDR